MSNTLTNLIPTVVRSLDIVSRELTGFTRAVFLDPSAEQVAKGATVYIPVSPSISTGTITPAATGPDPSAQTAGSKSLTISNYSNATFFWEGEEEFAMGDRLTRYMEQQFQQCFRALGNAIETSLGALYVSSSRATGTAGTTPFGGTTLTDLPAAMKILKDNGCPMGDLHAVFSTSAGANLLGFAQLQKINETGDQGIIRDGRFGRLQGFDLHESAQVASHTKGTATGIDVNNGPGYVAGDVTIVSDGSDSGTLLAGDVVTWAGDSNKYICTTSSISGAASGNVVLNAPGLRSTLATTVEMTIGNSYTANLAFDRSAIVLATRLPKGIGSETERFTVTDPVSGISFEVRKYLQNHRVAYEVGIAYGVVAVKPAHIVTILG